MIKQILKLWIDDTLILKDFIDYQNRGFFQNYSLENNKRKNPRPKKFNINTYLNTELPCKDEGKQIIYNTVKAAIYGINIREIPSMERKIESYIAPDKKTKNLVINSLCFNQQYTNREETKNIKIKSTGLLPWGKLPRDS